MAPRRLAGVEGLRGVAAAAVLVSHVFLYASPAGGPYDLGLLSTVTRHSGTAGVVLFFTLSGFLLYGPFAVAVLDGSRLPPVGAYLRNRALRVLPAYWLALVVLGLLLRTTYLPPAVVSGRSLGSEPEVLLANLLLVQGYAPSTLLTGIGPAWSLTVEVGFYVLLPALAWAAWTVATRTAAGRRRPWAAALLPGVVLVVLGQAGWRVAAALPATDGGSWTGSWHAVVSRSLLAHAGLFAAGTALAVLRHQVLRGAVVLPGWWRPVAAAGAVLLTATAVLLLDSGRLSESPATLALSVGFTCLLALVVLPRPGRASPAALLSSRPLQWSGLVSYGVFLWHEPLVWLLRRQGATTTGVDGFLLALLSTTVVAGTAALLSWRLVERPALALKRSGPTARTGAGLGTGAAPP